MQNLCRVSLDRRPPSGKGGDRSIRHFAQWRLPEQLVPPDRAAYCATVLIEDVDRPFELWLDW
jgi:hypothetical protein